MAVDSLGAPQDVFPAESPDEGLHFSRDRRSSRLSSRLPAPPESEHATLPGDNGVRLHQARTRTPPTPEPREDRPEYSESPIESRTRFALLKDPILTQRKLTPERDKLERDAGSVAEERREERGRRPDELADWEDGVGKTVAGLFSSFHASSVAAAGPSGQAT